IVGQTRRGEFAPGSGAPSTRPAGESGRPHLNSMTMTTRNGQTTDNPRGKHDSDQPSRTQFPLPEAPRTGSPVPWLTSIHATPGRGKYGDPAFRGTAPDSSSRTSSSTTNPGASSIRCRGAGPAATSASNSGSSTRGGT